jgi:hypothetical protein
MTFTCPLVQFLWSSALTCTIWTSCSTNFPFCYWGGIIWCASLYIKTFLTISSLIWSFAVGRGAGHWCPLSYLFYNLIFFLILLWAVHHREGDEPVQMVSWLLQISRKTSQGGWVAWTGCVCLWQAVAVGAVSIVLDVMVLSLYFPSSYRECYSTVLLSCM